MSLRAFGIPQLRDSTQNRSFKHTVDTSCYLRCVDAMVAARLTCYTPFSMLIDLATTHWSLGFPYPKCTYPSICDAFVIV